VGSYSFDALSPAGLVRSLWPFFSLFLGRICSSNQSILSTEQHLPAESELTQTPAVVGGCQSPLNGNRNVTGAHPAPWPSPSLVLHGEPVPPHFADYGEAHEGERPAEAMSSGALGRGRFRGRSSPGAWRIAGFVCGSRHEQTINLTPWTRSRRPHCQTSTDRGVCLSAQPAHLWRRANDAMSVYTGLHTVSEEAAYVAFDRRCEHDLATSSYRDDTRQPCTTS